MKTAEEWIKERNVCLKQEHPWAILDATPHAVPDFIKQIQLDAIKYGMELASKMGDQYFHESRFDPAIQVTDLSIGQNRGVSAYQKAILTAANNLKELPI